MDPGNIRPDGRLGAAQYSDVYGAYNFGPTSTHLGSPLAATQTADGMPPVLAQARQQAVAAFFLTTPGGIALLAAGVLIVLSLSD